MTTSITMPACMDIYLSNPCLADGCKSSRACCCAFWLPCLRRSCFHRGHRDVTDSSRMIDWRTVFSQHLWTRRSMGRVQEHTLLSFLWRKGMKVGLGNRLETENCVLCCVGIMLSKRNLWNNSVLGEVSPTGSDPSTCQENCTLNITKGIERTWTDEEMCVGWFR